MSIDEWPWVKDIIGPLIAGVMGLGAGLLANRSREKTESGRRDVDYNIAQIGFDQVQMSTITDRFKALLDGYERRINDLTKEVDELRRQLESAQRQLKEHT